ncbi:MAG: type 4 pilus major pilin [Alphaproteobacteria bacterium]
MTSSNNETGRSMIEMLGVLAIIGVLSVGGIAGYSKAMMQYKINKTVDQVSQIVGNVRTLYASQKNYGGLGTGSDTNGDTLLKKAHAVPDEMWSTDGTKIENAFGGRVYINAGNKKASNDEKAFGIDLFGIPEDACMALATYDWGSGSSSGLLVLGVNTSTVAAMFGDGYCVGCAGTTAAGKAIACPNGATVSIPMPVNVAATACQTGDNNWISILFY